MFREDFFCLMKRFFVRNNLPDPLTILCNILGWFDKFIYDLSGNLVDLMSLFVDIKSRILLLLELKFEPVN